MIESVKEHENLAVEVLKVIKNNGNLSELESSHQIEDIMEALNYCVDNKLVTGYITNRVASGRIVADRKEHVFVTIDGLKFIESFTGEETSIIAKNALAKARKADIYAKIAIGISIIALFADADKIYNNVSKVLNDLLNLIKSAV
jgi:hypothetical protein